MSNVTTQWTVGRWNNRASLTYQPICNPIGGTIIDPFGRKKTDPEYCKGPRRYFKSETTDSNITFVMYDDDSQNDVPIIKLTEV